jgi:hypothetical protein
MKYKQSADKSLQFLNDRLKIEEITINKNAPD